MRKLSPKQREALEAIAARRILPALCREEDGWHARWRGVPDDGNPWLDSLVREAIASPLCADAESRRYETVHDAWLAALQSRTGLVARDPAECEALAADLEEWRGSADASPEDRRAVAFSLVQRGETVSVECEVPRGRRALRALGQAAYVFPPLKNMRRAHGADGKSVLSVSLNQREAEDFVRVGAKELSDAGYPVRGVPPPSLVDAAVDVAEATAEADMPPSQPREFEAKVTVRVDGEPVNAEEVRFLLDQKSTFVFFRNRWIEVDRGVLKEALRVLERQSVRRIGLNEAVAFVAGVGCAGTLDVAEANAHGWIRGLVNELKSRTVCQATSPTAVLSGFEGELRPYQKRGVAWMRFLTGNGFGALLADDMGLGKTVQTIAWMASLHGRRNGASAPFLVVAPVTLLANWRREIGRFAPTFKVVVHHGASRNPGELLAAAVSDADVVLTSYPVFVKDYPFLRRIRWDGLVLDEAQTIRNHETRAARAASALGAPRRVALTGTPVENSVADIWSIENCLNPGFLGDRKSFVERYAKPPSIGSGGPAAARLAAALEPFVLRRLKTDPAVAAEIGPKQEKVEYCELTPLQIREYEDAVSSYRRGTGRRGDALALITRLKLVCDGLHVGADGAPDAAAFAAGGKFLRLAELLDSIFAAGESALVFTQYAKVGAMLKTALETRFARPAPFLHGSLSAAAREAEIAKFRGSTAPSAFVLSVKAGGLGLNLVKATRVVHFDRWWNPAVEAQATDRAHRIGQANAVFVHKFVAEGTLEERVDAIIERKAGVAGAAVASGESFLMSLADDELLETVSLRRGEAARG